MMDEPDKSRHLARLFNLTFLRSLPTQQRLRLAQLADESESPDDLPEDERRLLQRAEQEYRRIA